MCPRRFDRRVMPRLCRIYVSISKARGASPHSTFGIVPCPDRRHSLTLKGRISRTDLSILLTALVCKLSFIGTRLLTLERSLSAGCLIVSGSKEARFRKTDAFRVIQHRLL